jgi:hypothetical protein
VNGKVFVGRMFKLMCIHLTCLGDSKIITVNNS